MININLSAVVKFDDKTTLGLRRQQRKIIRNYLVHAGGYLRTVIRRSLRKARRIRYSELPDDAQEKYREDLEDFRNGYRKSPPVLRDIVSSPGQPPLLHMMPSPLRNGIKFDVDEDAAVVVIGGVKDRGGFIDQIEAKRPFVGPAYTKTLPKLPLFFQNAVSKG